MQTAALPTKPHYQILDGLRGVAAVIVVAFHLCEAHAASRFTQLINHGYLAVDFFFLLSGFVIAYAYDDRWTKMSIGEFFTRRLIRLQPMVVIGMLAGASLFYFQSSALWPTISQVPVWKTLLLMLIGFTLLPVPPSLDIRGWQEMHPLNGPGWSLFFEYLANILYAVGIRKLSNTTLAIIVFVTGCALIHLTTLGPNGDVIGGWSLTAEQLRIGFTRMLYPFLAGLLLSRTVRLRHISGAFFWCSLLLLLILALPRLGGPERLWLNGLYESVSIILLFPLIVFLGASGEIKGAYAARVCKFLGAISYPLYITHYPFIYTYTAWVNNHKPSTQQALPVALLTFGTSVIFAYACLRWYDVPVRNWLARKLLPGRKSKIPVAGLPV